MEHSIDEGRGPPISMSHMHTACYTPVSTTRDMPSSRVAQVFSQCHAFPLVGPRAGWLFPLEGVWEARQPQRVERAEAWRRPGVLGGDGSTLSDYAHGARTRCRATPSR